MRLKQFRPLFATLLLLALCACGKRPDPSASLGPTLEPPDKGDECPAVLLQIGFDEPHNPPLHTNEYLSALMQEKDWNIELQYFCDQIDDQGHSKGEALKYFQVQLAAGSPVRMAF